jgi:hypothetical protein
MIIFSASAALESTVCPPMAQDASAPNAGVCEVSALSRNLCYLISTYCPYIRRDADVLGVKKRRRVYDLGHTTPKIIKGTRFCLTLSGWCLSRDAFLCLSVIQHTAAVFMCIVWMCVCMCVCTYVRTCMLCTYVHVCMYMYVCMYVCTYIYVCMYVHLCIYVCMYVHLCIYVCMYVHVCICMYYVRTCMSVTLSLSIYIYMCVCVCVQTTHAHCPCTNNTRTLPLYKQHTHTAPHSV